MKRKQLVTSTIVVLVLVLAMLAIKRRLPIITGYASKNLCSCVFVDGMEADSAIKKDLNFSFIKYAKHQIDYKNKVVVSTILGMTPRKAIYREGFGCTLLAGEVEDNLAGRDFPGLPDLPFNPDTVYWPVGELIKDTILDGVDYQELDQTIQSVFDSDTVGCEFCSRAVLVIYKGEIVAEKYLEGFNKYSVFLGWSMTKSFMSSLTGILVTRGDVDLESHPPVSGWGDDIRKNITYRHLLQMTSGLEWNEGYGDRSDVTRMLFMNGDAYQYAIQKRATDRPDSAWEYSSGTANLVSGLLRKQFTNDIDYWKFPYQELFHPAGMYNTMIETDVSGNFYGSSYGHATTRDWGRYGLLYLNQGYLNGHQILSPDWVGFSSRPTIASDSLYGAMFWTNASGHLPDVPGDAYSAQGHHDQRVFIVPSKQLVIVRLGLNSHNSFDFNKFVSEVCNSVK